MAPAPGFTSTPLRPVSGAGRASSLRFTAGRAARPPAGAPRRHPGCERGGVAVESAIALAILVGAFAGLMHVVGTVFAGDEMGRGARAVARALALDPNADPWTVLGRELGRDAALCPGWTDTTTSAECGGWTLVITRGVSPGGLEAALGGGTAAAGEMVLVRIEGTRPAWSSGGVVPDADAQGAGADSGASVNLLAIGLARSEPEA